MNQTEKQIENQILFWLRAQGIYSWKNQSVGIFDAKKQVFRKSKNPWHINGVADILGVIEGRFLSIEVKSKKGVHSDSQKTFAENVGKNGGIYILARSVEDVQSALSSEGYVFRTRFL